MLKSFQEMYNRPKNGELGLLSAQPDSRSAEPSLKAQKWVQLSGSSGVSGLVAAEALTAACTIQPDGHPKAR